MLKLWSNSHDKNHTTQIEITVRAFVKALQAGHRHVREDFFFFLFLHNAWAEKKGNAFEMSTAYSKRTAYITLGLNMRQHAKYFTVVGFSCPGELIKLFLI